MIKWGILCVLSDKEVTRKNEENSNNECHGLTDSLGENRGYDTLDRDDQGLPRRVLKVMLSTKSVDDKRDEPETAGKSGSVDGR